MLKLVILLLVLIMIPCFLGGALAKMLGIYQEKRVTDTIFAFTAGTVCMWAVFQLLAVPMILLKMPFHMLVRSWCVLTAALMLLLMVVSRRAWPFPRLRKPEASWHILLILLMAALIGFQMYQYVFKMHIDEDDSRFVVTAVEAYEKNTMLLIHPVTGENMGTWIGERVKDVASPWMLYVALISKLCMIHPTILAHTVLPVVLLLTAYCIYWLIGDILMKRDFIKTALFVIFASLLIRYYGGSTWTQGSFMLVRIWQGKAVFCAVMIPAVFLAFLLQQEKPESSRLWLLFFIVGCASCLMSGMGIFLGGVLIGIDLVYYIFVCRKWKMLWKIPVCCLPSAAYGLIYLLVK